MIAPSVTAADIADARRVLAGFLQPTRLVTSKALSTATSRNVWLKLESELPTGSFKVRGALYALHRALRERKVAEVIASSTGNHGAAVAYAARELGVRATIFLPENPNPVKRATIEKLGARIVTAGARDLSEAFEVATVYAAAHDVYFLNDATDPVLPAGPATIGSEILQQAPDVQAVYVPVGDTALIRGVATAIRLERPAVVVAGVQAEKAPAYYLSWKSGRVIATETCDTIADGLATRTPDPANVAAVRDLVPKMTLVSEEEMMSAIRLLASEGVIAEPAAAAPAAAILKEPPESQNIVLIVTGSNLSPELRRKTMNDER